jgi:hypothetical protein
MAKKSVLCVVTSPVQASQIVGYLQDEGFSRDDISALFPDTHGTSAFAREKGTQAPESAVAGAGTGAVFGGTLGWLAGVGALAIPGVGPLVAVGPIAATLSGAAVGGTLGGLVGALMGWGVPEPEAKRYEGRIKEGGILISVHADNSNEVKRVKAIYEQVGAQDVAVAGESGGTKRKKREIEQTRSSVNVRSWSSN